MLGAAVGGSLLGNLGDRIGRARAMGVSILFYSVFAGLGRLSRSASKCCAAISGRPGCRRHVAQWRRACGRVLAQHFAADVAGILGAGINVGILGFSISGRCITITPDSWRWIFAIAAIPAVLGVSC